MSHSLRFRRFPLRCILLLNMAVVLINPNFAHCAEFNLSLTRQTPVVETPNRFHRISDREMWQSNETALIICDMWDSHHCVNAVRRAQEIAPRINSLAKTLRANGATIIHAPSDCMANYESHPARIRAQKVPVAKNLPDNLNRWCDKIPAEEAAAYPIDQSDGGEDDALEEHAQWAQTLADQGRNPKLPWRKQNPTIEIDSDQDYVSQSGDEVWNILESRGIRHVLVCGVHINMCVLGRPFGLRQLSSHGKQAVLVRDLTDTMYNPAQWPFINHFSGTDRVIDHTERYVCSTTTSDQLFANVDQKPLPAYAVPHRFSNDRRFHLAILIAENEYETALTLPAFSETHLEKQMRVSYIYGDGQDHESIPGLEALELADALLVSVRRHPLKPIDLNRIQSFVRSGKPVLGIRTASHAFSLRDGKQIAGLSQWPEFDAYTFGGNYTNHHQNDLQTTVLTKQSNPLFTSQGSLYQVSPLKPGTRVELFGKVKEQNEEPVAWTFVRADGGYSFYTSLGHPSDFEEPLFRAFLLNAILNACGQPSIAPETIAEHEKRYTQGRGKQR